MRGTELLSLRNNIDSKAPVCYKSSIGGTTQNKILLNVVAVQKRNRSGYNISEKINYCPMNGRFLAESVSNEAC